MTRQRLWCARFCGNEVFILQLASSKAHESRTPTAPLELNVLSEPVYPRMYSELSYVDLVL